MDPKRVKPVTRQELLDLAVTDVDPFGAQRYLRHRDTVPSLPDLEEKGQEPLPGTEGVLCDLYHSLWSPEPEVKEEVAPDRRYWQELLGQAVKSSAYEELHGQTQLKELQSVLGTIAMGESVIAMVPKEDQKQLQELAEAQADADDMSQQAASAQAQAQAAQALADAMGQQAAGQGQPGQGQPSDQQADGQPQPGAGQPAPGQPQPQAGQPSGQPAGGMGQMTPEQAKALANELAQAVAKAQADAKAANELAKEAKAKAEQLAENLMGKPGTPEAQKKLDELRRMGLTAVRDAQAKVEEVSETIEAWGLDPGELYRQGIPEALGILERMKRNQAFRKFAALLGRIRKIAARKARSKIAGEGARVTVQETGRDIKRAVPSELVDLVHPALRIKALQRWTRGELRLHGQKTKQKLGHGPVVVCEDGSGSMEGAKQQWAKAVTLSLAHYAKLQNRSFGWILFDYGVRKSKSYPQGRLSAEQMLELAESRAGGGTDFESPLRKAMEMIRNEGLKKADIAFITDGECEVSDAFLRELKAVKKALEVNVITVLCDVGSTSNSAVQEFSDRIETVSDFTAGEAETKVIRHL